MFFQTLRVTVDILFLRRGPQDMPASWNLLGALAALYLIVHVAQALIAASFGSALLQALVATALLAAYTRIALQLREHLPRLAQTLSALFAVGIVATVVLLGPTAAMGSVLQQLAQGGNPQTIEQPPIFAVLLALVVFIWLVIADAHIFRHALDVSMGIGVLVALGFQILLPIVFGLLLGLA